MKKITIEMVLSITIIIIGITLIFVERKRQDFEYEKYVDTGLRFEISYPKGWRIEKGVMGDLSRDKYVKFYGQIKRQKRISTEFCDPKKFPALIEIDVGDDASFANFGPVTNEEDAEKYLNTQKGVIEKFSVNNRDNLLVSKATGGVAPCFHNLYLGWVVTNEGKHYRINFWGDEDRYDIIRPIFESFKLLE